MMIKILYVYKTNYLIDPQLNCLWIVFEFEN